MGLEAIYPVNDRFTVYAQIAKVDAPSYDTQDSAGYVDGSVARIGAYYAGFDRTTLYLDYEVGRSDVYEDSNEPGEFSLVTIGGETAIGAGNWAVTYAANFGSFDAVGDTDLVEETSYGIGVRYYFGGATAAATLDAGMIGTPQIPLRASTYVTGTD